MVLDMKLEIVMERKGGSDDEGSIYKAANWSYGGAYPQAGHAQVAYLETPCSYCRLKNECGPANEINPQTCEYMQDWLEMF